MKRPPLLLCLALTAVSAPDLTAQAAATAPAGAPVPGCPTSIRITCGAPGGNAACRALAAEMTSMTMNGGAKAPLPTFSAMTWA